GISTFGEWVADLDAEAYERAVSGRSGGGAGGGGVVLKTIHGAKGEEYRRVMVLYVANGYFPPTSWADLEEERRLFYVALTRAEEELLVIGQAGNVFFDDLLEVGEGDIRLFEWTRPITTGSEKASGSGTGEGAGRVDPRRIRDETAAMRREAAGRDRDEEYIPIANTNLLNRFRSMFGTTGGGGQGGGER